MTDLLAALLDAVSVRQVTDIIEAFTQAHQPQWRAVGDRENNLATINLGSDPAAGLVERVTNAIDAVLEREWIQRGEPTNLRSPRDAVAHWFGIPEGRLENISDARAPEIGELSRRVQVSLRESERPDRPTVEVRDFGVGLRARAFPSSIVGLNETRKLKRFFPCWRFRTRWFYCLIILLLYHHRLKIR